jgi:hypothetical protein
MNNNHTEIRERLPAYCGGDLEPAECSRIEAHLASCPACRADLADLRITLRLIRSVPEIEPPTWLTARIMAHLREETTVKRSWLQRLCFPRQTAFPMKVLALLVVCVSGYYLSRSVDSELQLAKQQQLQENPAQQAPLSAPLAAPDQAPAGRDKSEQPAPQQPKKAAAPASAPQPAQRPENIPTLPAPHIQSAPSPRGYAPPQPALKDLSGGKAEAIKTPPTVNSSDRDRKVSPEMKTMMKKSRSLESSSDAAAPAAAGRAAGAAAGLATRQVMVRMGTNDPETAPALIREAVIRTGGTITEEAGPSGQRLTARIQTARLNDLLDRLQQLGRFMERPATPPAEAGLLEITIQW